MKVMDLYPTKYLKTDDLRDGRMVAEIASIAIEDVGGDGNQKDHKMVLYFLDGKKGFVLNKTNAMLLSEMYGEETDHWLGLPVAIRKDRTQFGGHMVDAMRIDMNDSAMLKASSQILQALVKQESGLNDPGVQPNPESKAANTQSTAVR